MHLLCSMHPRNLLLALYESSQGLYEMGIITISISRRRIQSQGNYIICSKSHSYWRAELQHGACLAEARSGQQLDESSWQVDDGRKEWVMGGESQEQGMTESAAMSTMETEKPGRLRKTSISILDMMTRRRRWDSRLGPEQVTSTGVTKSLSTLYTTDACGVLSF